jgi:hypothetical protein
MRNALWPAATLGRNIPPALPSDCGPIPWANTIASAEVSRKREWSPID